MLNGSGRFGRSGTSIVTISYRFGFLKVEIVVLQKLHDIDTYSFILATSSMSSRSSIERYGKPLFS